MNKSLTIQLLLCFLTLLSQAQKSQNQRGVIVLNLEKMKFLPKEFYIEKINDYRENKDAVAYIFPLFNKNSKIPNLIAFDLSNGCFNAVKDFIEKATPKNKEYHPLEIQLKKFILLENITNDGKIKGDCYLSFSFNLLTDYGESKYLSDFTATSSYYRGSKNRISVEPILRQMLENGLNYINTWMTTQAASNILLAKKTEIKFTDYFDKVEGDTIYYASNRPLKWDDFQSKTESSKYAAMVFPSFGYNERVLLNNGIINVVLAMKIFVPKSACWVKNGAGTSYALNHEQRHFDIAKIVAERFKQNLTAVLLPVNNYDGVINVQYFDSLRELSKLEKQYDDETAHGVNAEEQHLWDTKIDNWLLEFSKRKVD